MKDVPEIRVELTGFRNEDSSTIEMVNKIVAKHLNRIGEIEHKADWIKVTMKKIHEREKGEKYEVHCHLHAPGKTYSAVFVDRNLMTSVDKVIEKAISEILHHSH